MYTSAQQAHAHVTLLQALNSVLGASFPAPTMCLAPLLPSTNGLHMHERLNC
jgi:hypothetical protein